MDEMLESLGHDVDLLLTEVCMTAAFYGLDAAVTGISDHLKDLPERQGAALLAQALSKIAVKDYAGAVALTDRVLDAAEESALHKQAAQFRSLASQLADGKQPVSI
ncbi:MAG: hypothetical protein VW831_00335 [Gammaproteobacteria bacterium]